MLHGQGATEEDENHGTDTDRTQMSVEEAAVECMDQQMAEKDTSSMDTMHGAVIHENPDYDSEKTEEEEGYE